MAYELTRRYAALFEKRGLGRLHSFVADLYWNQKLAELLSFVAWELAHRLKLFPAGSYLRFRDSDPLALDGASLTSPAAVGAVGEFFGSRGLRATRSRDDWKHVFVKPDGEALGSLVGEDRNLYRSSDRERPPVFVARFPSAIRSLFVSSRNTIFVCTKRTVYRSADDGASFEESLKLSCRESYFRPNNGMTETRDGTLVVAEYGNLREGRVWRKIAYLYFSPDNGKSWEASDFLIQQGANKHVHVVHYVEFAKQLLVADGDNKKRLWASEPFETLDPARLNWRLVNKFHIQLGGYTSIVEADGKLLLGTDYQGGTNFVVESTDCRTFVKKVVPDPYRRSPIDNMVVRRSKSGGHEVWANLPYATASSRSLLMYTADGGQSWERVFDYDRRGHKVWLISSSGTPASDELYVSIEDLKSGDRVVYRIVDMA